MSEQPQDRPAALPGRFRYRLRLQTRFIVYFTALVAGIMAFVILLVENRLKSVIVEQEEKRGLSIARNLAAVSQPALVTYNYIALTQAAESARRKEEGIAGVIILDKEGRVAAYSDRGDRQGEVLSDPVSLRAAEARSELVQPIEIGTGAPGEPERGLDISVPVFLEGSDEKWGSVRLRLSMARAQQQIDATRRALLGLGLLAAGLGALGSYVMARRIAVPVSDLVSGTIRAARGDLATRIDIRTGDEVEELAKNFNTMIERIASNQRAIEELNRDLEQKVQLRTLDFSRANDALKAAYAELQQAEAQMILSEKMASLGLFVAGIAHEINTPSSAINAAIFNITGYLETLTRQLPALLEAGIPGAIEQRFHDVIAKALSADPTRRRATTAEIRQRSRALETALGAHGFESPRELALTFARLGLGEEIEALVAAAGPGPRPQLALAFLENVGNLAIAVSDVRLSIEAITRMVKALRSYSHKDQTDMAEADIHDGLETTLTILRNQIKYGVVVERRYGRIPHVVCNTSELNQVWANIIHNAIQAMKGMGTLTLETERKGESVLVRIADTGPGIPSRHLSRIFDPFFTTKDQGEGSGLGLGIAQQIVKRHHGAIRVESEPGRTVFEVLLPLAPRPVEASA